MRDSDSFFANKMESDGEQVSATVVLVRQQGVVSVACSMPEAEALIKAGRIRSLVLDSADFAEFMKADNEDNGKALKSFGLAK